MDESAYPLHAAAEERHWWFVGRRRVARQAIASLGLAPGAKILEFGAGTGGNLPLLGEFGAAVTALEPNDEARAISAARHPAARHVGDFAPLVGERFDAAMAFDVLEHLDDPEFELKRIAQHLNPNAPLLATVPAHPWLFGAHDRYLHHRRRYTRQELKQHLQAGGFNIEVLTATNVALFPVAVAARVGEAVRERFGGGPEARARGMELPNALINKTLENVFAAERFLFGKVALPMGLSWLAVARVNR